MKFKLKTIKIIYKFLFINLKVEGKKTLGELGIQKLQN